MAAKVEDELAPLRARADQNAWKVQLRRRGDAILGDEANIVAALRSAPALKGIIRFNDLALTVELIRSPPWREAEYGECWVETDDTALIVWLQEQGLNVRGRGAAESSIVLVARDAAYHPIRDYLGGLVWDGQPRLRTWLHDYLRAEGDVRYLAAVGLRFLVSAVARVMDPGCQVDHTLTLDSEQGFGKTSAVRTMAVRPEWYCDNLPMIGSKDAQVQLVGHWIVELAELSATQNSRIEAVKAFLTVMADTFRPPYGRRTGRFPRQCVFVGTTNASEYLKDRTGNRRYWPVHCGRVRLDALVADRDQLWAEAMHEYQAGTPWHLTAEEASLAADEQADRVQVTELETRVEAFLKEERAAGRIRVTVGTVLQKALRLDPRASSYLAESRKHATEVAAAIEHCGWKKVPGRHRVQGSRETVYEDSFPVVQGVQGS